MDYPRKTCFDDNYDQKVGKSFSQKLIGCFVEDPLTSNSFAKYFANGKHPQPQYTTSQQFSVGRSPRKVFEGKEGPSTHDVQIG